MENNLLLTLLMPMAIGVIVLGLGLSLTLEDFRRVIKYPKAVTIALVCQMLLLPFLCWCLAIALALPPVIAVGMMILAASPGGATANFYSHLSNGDVALNITLTALNSLLSLFTLPLIVNLSLAYFIQGDDQVSMQFQKVVEVFSVVLVPVTLGMLIRNKYENFALKMEKPVKIASVVFLATIILVMIYSERANLFIYLRQAGLAVLIFNIMNLTLGYLIPGWFGIPKKQAIAIGMEIGIHNGTLAIYIAISVLNNTQMAIPPALYGVLMLITAAVFASLIKSRNEHTLGYSENKLA